VTLTTSTMPAHPHAYIASTTAGNANSPQNNLAANGTTFISPYLDLSAKTAMGANSIGFTGGSQPHDNMQPYLCIDFIISLFGVYPSPT
jgi:microcystin-dependent protein